MPRAPYRDVFERIRSNTPGMRAVAVVGLDGAVVGQLVSDPTLNLESLSAEYATLFRIAWRTSEDTGAGEVFEFVLVADKSTIIAQKISSESYLILIIDAAAQLGRARYELKKGAWTLQMKLPA